MDNVNECTCPLCKYNRGLISKDEYRKSIIQSLIDNVNDDSVEPYSEYAFDEDCMALYELETKGNAFSDKNIKPKINELLKKYGVTEGRTSDLKLTLPEVVRRIKNAKNTK